MQFHDSSWYVLGMLNRFSTPFWPIFGDVMMMWSCQDFSSFSDVCLGECPVMVIYWLVVYLPLWKIWVRQLGWWNIPNIYIYIPIYGKIKFMFQTTNQAIIICMQYDHYHDIPTDGWFPMGNSQFVHQWPARLWAFFFTLGMGNSAFRMGKSSQVIYFCGPRIPWQTVTRGYNIPIDGWFPVKSPWKKSNQSSNWSFPKMLPSNPSH